MLANPAPQLVAQSMEMDAFGIDHRFPHHHLAAAPPPSPPQQIRRKRRAEAQPENNERLSKQKSGTKLYVPVENSLAQSATFPAPSSTSQCDSSSTRRKPAPSAQDDAMMQLDDSKYKVYIYNMEDEMSSESEAEDGGKLVFLPDIEKHMRSQSILPAHMLAAGAGRPDAAELAGKELVLYSVPNSISVPEEQDSVRKAIIEARARAREKQMAHREGYHSAAAPLTQAPAVSPAFPVSGFASQAADDDQDAMELD
ncbi:hypothetical protein B0T24DRAFT_673568 [Lasiosphaeria ovina]|uniref:Uncharacterized protein n=1 Tax=Lasiosphaeria ovina TaxID=92902 RepID=A0AAE0NLU0_9PEZI|nr:hypothetical protein B0T24DRAFT_673568 [Lasiosphaeria ovina]